MFCLCECQPVSNPDFVIPVEIDGTIHQVCQRGYVMTFSAESCDVLGQVPFLSPRVTYIALGGNSPWVA